MMNNPVPPSPEEWRTEPEIDVKRQEERRKCLAIVPEINEGIYPFKGMKLSRADIEWLLATHENGRGPVNWNDVSQRKRKGLDLRGVDLTEDVEFRDLPLGKANLSWARLEGTILSWAHLEGTILSGAHLERADLSGAHLEEARLSRADLQYARLEEAHLEGADLREAHLEGTILSRARLERADLSGAHLDGANLSEAHLEGADLLTAGLKGASLIEAHLEGTELRMAHLEGAGLWAASLQDAHLAEAHLEEASLEKAHLERANLSEAHLQDAHLAEAHLEEASLEKAHLERADLSRAHLERANLSGVSLEKAVLDGITLADNNHVGPQVAGIQWGETNLIVVDWSRVAILGDEYQACQKQESKGTKKVKAQRLDEYKTAVRANRQLAVALQDQGLNEDAARFAYRAKVLERQVLWYQVRGGQVRQLGAYLFSWFLALLTGYGFRVWRIIVAYALIVLAFAVAYWGLGFQAPPSLNFWQAVIVSVTAFHGRVFANPFTLNEPQIAFTALEAIFGLVIEGVFIAMLVQRFFGK